MLSSGQLSCEQCFRLFTSLSDFAEIPRNIVQFVTDEIPDIVLDFDDILCCTVTELTSSLLKISVLKVAYSS